MVLSNKDNIQAPLHGHLYQSCPHFIWVVSIQLAHQKKGRHFGLHQPCQVTNETPLGGPQKDEWTNEIHPSHKIFQEYGHVACHHWHRLLLLILLEIYMDLTNDEKVQSTYKWGEEKWEKDAALRFQAYQMYPTRVMSPYLSRLSWVATLLPSRTDQSKSHDTMPYAIHEAPITISISFETNLKKKRKKGGCKVKLASSFRIITGKWFFSSHQASAICCCNCHHYV